MQCTSGPAGPQLRRTQSSPPIRGLGVPPKVCAHLPAILALQNEAISGSHPLLVRRSAHVAASVPAPSSARRN